MSMIGLLLDELEREGARSKRTLEAAPAHKSDWKPHDRSMAFGPLASMVATIPSWVAMEVTLNELDIKPKDGPSYRPAPMDTSEALVAAYEKAMAEARAALKETNEDFLKTHWQLLAGGEVMMDVPRHVMIRDTINHWVHHRGQMTVYLRLMGAKVPSLYGPSADDSRFL